MNDDNGGYDDGGDFSTIINEDGTFADGWYEGFPEDSHETLSRFKRFEDLPKSYMDLRSKFNKPVDRLVVIPDEKSTEEEWAAYRQRIGVPQDATGYEFELNPELKNVAIDPDKLNAFRAIAKKHDIPGPKFQDIVNDWLAVIDKEAGDFELIQANKDTLALEADNKVMNEYFGEAKEERIALADAMLRKYNAEIKNDKGEVVASAAQKLVEKYPDITHSPWLVMILDKIREDMAPARLQGLTGISTPTNAAIKIRIAELRNNPAYADISNPDHKRIHQEVIELYKQMSA